MRNVLFAAVAATALLASGVASASVLANFQLNGNLTNGAGGGVTLTNNGGALGANGISFAANDGPTLNGLGTVNAYNLEIGGTFDATAGWRKIADFSNRVYDVGFYNYYGALVFYGGAGGSTGQMTDGTPFVARLTRDSSALVTGYLNGVSQFTFTDTSGYAQINNVLHLFRDDAATGYGEAGSGFIDYVTLTNDPNERVVSGSVPEPASWALMILGFGGVGAMIRRQRGLLFA